MREVVRRAHLETNASKQAAKDSSRRMIPSIGKQFRGVVWCRVLFRIVLCVSEGRGGVGEGVWGSEGGRVGGRVGVWVGLGWVGWGGVGVGVCREEGVRWCVCVGCGVGGDRERGGREGRREGGREGGADVAITCDFLSINTHACNDLCEMLTDSTAHHELTNEPKPERSTANICWPSRAHTYLSAFDIHLHVEN